LAWFSKIYHQTKLQDFTSNDGNMLPPHEF